MSQPVAVGDDGHAFRTPGVFYHTMDVPGVGAFISVLGFEDSEVRYHVQVAGGRRERLFTMIGRRTHGSPAVPSPV